MIAAFARTARVLAESTEHGGAVAVPYLTAARRAAEFLRERMWSADKRRLLRRYRKGHARSPQSCRHRRSEPRSCRTHLSRGIGSERIRTQASA